MSKLRIPETWPSTCYLHEIEPVGDGSHALTHLAAIRGPDGNRLRAYVKHFDTDAHRGLFNEWFAYVLMSQMGVPQPQAALIKAPVPHLPGHPLAWAFASCEPSPRHEGTPKQRYRIDDPSQHRALVKRLFDCTALPLLIAADQLLNNPDRNIGNLVFTGEKTFVAIDHSLALGGDCWSIGDLAYTQKWAPSKLIEGLVQISSLPQPMRNSIYASAEVMSAHFFENQLALRTALECGSEQECHAAVDAIWWRCLPLSEWFKDRLGLLT